MQSGRGPVSQPATIAAYAVYGLAMAEIAALSYFTMDLLNGAGADSGGQAMGLFFFVLLPLIAILAGLAAFLFGSGFIRGGGLALMLVPSALYVWFAL